MRFGRSVSCLALAMMTFPPIPLAHARPAPPSGEKPVTTGGQPRHPAPVNDVCPVGGGKVDVASPTREYKGHTIGFCCPGCERKWDARPEADKATFLAKYVGDSAAATQAPSVTLMRVPDGGVQPRVVIDPGGAAHAVFFKGEPTGGDIWYAQKAPREAGFGKAIRVNSQPGSAVSLGTIRGPQIAVGKNGRVHVAWNGSSSAEPRGPKDPSGNASDPMLYARLNDAGTAFEPQRCVATKTVHLDGGGSIAADTEGRVIIGWHAAEPGGGLEESARRFFVARSTDDGQTFSPETPAVGEPLGACACCGTAGTADSAGRIHFLYRAAKENVHRDLYRLTSNDGGESFTANEVHPWHVNQCPMSTAWLAEGGNPANGLRSTVLAWETQGQVYFARLDPTTGRSGPAIAASGDAGARKHPAVAVDEQGRVLLAWTEGAGWARGGSVAWELFDAEGRPVPGSRQQRTGADGVKEWNCPAAFVSDGKFVVLY